MNMSVMSSRGLSGHMVLPLTSATSDDLTEKGQTSETMTICKNETLYF